MRILAISGTLRASSSNTALLQASTELAQDVEVVAASQIAADPRMAAVVRSALEEFARGIETITAVR